VLEVEAELDGFGARGDEVCAAEGGEEVIERVFVGQVDDGEAKAPLVAVAAEEVVVADRHVEEVARSDARRILVVVFGAVGGDVDAGGAVPVGQLKIALVGVANVEPQNNPIAAC
jgi:hypothetical protein